MPAATPQPRIRPGHRAAIGLATAALIATGVAGTAVVATADDAPRARPEPTMTALAPAGTAVPTIAPTSAPIGERFARTELFFGTERPGPDVTNRQFKAFVDRVVTPRFPDGLTQYDASGQFRDSTGRIVKEQSKVIVLLYPIADAGQSTVKIEEIRDIYEKAFDQESVLRADSVELVDF
ncbi:MAG: DUF3574 domain-containing protein [Microlunatus sp.]